MFMGRLLQTITHVMERHWSTSVRANDSHNVDSAVFFRDSRSMYLKDLLFTGIVGELF